MHLLSLNAPDQTVTPDIPGGPSFDTIDSFEFSELNSAAGTPSQSIKVSSLRHISTMLIGVNSMLSSDKMDRPLPASRAAENHIESATTVAFLPVESLDLFTRNVYNVPVQSKKQTTKAAAITKFADPHIFVLCAFESLKSVETKGERDRPGTFDVVAVGDNVGKTVGKRQVP